MITAIRDAMGRVYGFAVFDVVGTLIGSYYISQRMETDYITTTVSIWALGEALHLAFGVQTPITRALS